jgi:hypothetical protein
MALARACYQIEKESFLRNGQQGLLDPFGLLW